MEQLELSCILVGVEIGSNLLEKCLACSKAQVIPLLNIYLKDLSAQLHKNSFYSSFTHNSQKLGTTHMSINRIEKLWYIHIIECYAKRNTDMWSKMSESQRYHVEQKSQTQQMTYLWTQFHEVPEQVTEARLVHTPGRGGRILTGRMNKVSSWVVAKFYLNLGSSFTCVYMC